MMRRERRAAPLLALLVFEVVAIIGLQAAGSNQAMQVPWGDFWTWVDTNSLDTLAMPMLRYAALGLAYWMLASTLLFVAAQLTRIPVAIKAAGMFTLPSVRRAVDGAMAVSIATTSVVGFAGAAVVLDGSSDTSTTSIANSLSGDLSINSGSATGGDAVATPSFGAASYSAAGTADMGDMDMGDVVDEGDVDLTTEDTTVDLTTTTTSADDLVTTSTTPSTTSSTITQAGDDSDQATTSLAPSAGSDFVPTPRPGAPITTTTVPQGPSTSATTPAPTVTTPAPTPAPATTSGTHRVVPGDNLWNIARDHLAETSGRDKHAVSEAEIRTYWLKVIDVNRDSLRSHDPHWIFPGEVITLPALDGAPTGS